MLRYAESVHIHVCRYVCRHACLRTDMLTRIKISKYQVCKAFMATLLITHLHSWSPFSALMVTSKSSLSIYTHDLPHGHPSLDSWSLFTHDHPTLYSWSPTVVTLLSTHGHLLRIHGHPSPHSWPPFSALMVTLLCTHGHPSLHSWSHFSALMAGADAGFW